MFDQEFCMQNSHFLPNKLDKPIFHKNFDLFFPMYPYTHGGNPLLIDENMFNMPYNAIFWSIFYYLHGKNHYLLGIVFPYLKFLYFSEYGISTFVHHNPFGRIISINCNDPRQFKMLFVKWNKGYKLSFCNNATMKMKQNKPY